MVKCLLSICYNYVTGLGDEKDTITTPEINHLQGLDQARSGKPRREVLRMVDNKSRET